MTDASKGLRKALARSGASVVAIAEMQASDLLAELSEEQKTALAAELAPAAAAGAAPAAGAAAAAGGEGEDDEPGDEDEEEAPPPAAASGAAPKADASERSRVKAVAKAVAEDETCKGKADLALQMLADDDFAGLNAAAMVKLLGKQTVAAAADDEAGARAEMKRALAETTNSGIDASSGGKGGGNSAGASASVWDKAIASVFPNHKAS